MAERENKREQILLASMKIFAEKGYDSTTIDEIGASLNMKGPALYYYFKSKEAILEELVSYIELQYTQRFTVGIPKERFPQTLVELTELSRQRVMTAISDEAICSMRRFLTKEQFRLPEIGSLLTKYSIFGIICFNREIFQYLMEIGEMKPGNAHHISFEYTTPFTVLMQIYDRNPEKREEVQKGIDAHISYFLNLYAPEKHEG